MTRNTSRISSVRACAEDVRTCIDATLPYGQDAVKRWRESVTAPASQETGAGGDRELRARAARAHGGDLGGFFLIRGEREQLQKLRAQEEFRRINTRATLVVDGFGVIDAHVGGGLHSQLSIYREQVQEQLST